LIQFHSLDAADCHAHAVAKEVAHMMIFQEFGIFGEDGTFLRLFHIGFEGHESLAARLVQEFVTQL
jgi:hypothetical protein